MIATSDVKPYNIRCTSCGKVHTIYIKPTDLIMYQAGKGYIQDIFDYLSAADRELMISQTCNDCWKRMYAHPIEGEEPEL